MKYYQILVKSIDFTYIFDSVMHHAYNEASEQYLRSNVLRIFQFRAGIYEFYSQIIIRAYYYSLRNIKVYAKDINSYRK